MTTRVAVIVDPALDGYTDGDAGPALGGPHWSVRACSDESGARALLGALAVDLVVVDGEAPVDVPSILAGARRLRPAAVRIVATRDGEPLPRALLSLVHHAVARPISAATVRPAMALVDRAFALVANPDLRSLLGEMGELPSLPAAIVELNSVLEDPDSGPEEIATLIASDVAVATQVLRFVNSPFFGLGRRITDLRDAVVLLGVATIHTLVSCTAVFRAFDVGADHDRMARLHEHALSTAEAAGRHAAPEVAREAFCAGLLHVVGDLLLEDRALASSIRRDAADVGVSIAEMELRTLGTTHAALGAHLLLTWGLPLEVVTAVALHHDPDPGDASPSEAGLGVTEAVRRACQDCALIDPAPA